MLTKTLRFDNDVLEVLSSMDWQNDGTLGIITGGQLERGLYTRVNKALEMMGGKWNRKSGGHVFATDPRPQVDGLVTTGALTVERDGFFETPRAVVERMLELVPPSREPMALTLEPSAGLGAIVRVLDDHGVDWIVMVEKNEQRCAELEKEFKRQDRWVIQGDFMNFQDHPGYRFDRIYMNPPFEELQDIAHVCHAYGLLSKYGALVAVMSESPFFRSDRKAEEFRLWLASVGGYSEKLPEGSFKESGTGVNARLVVIKKHSYCDNASTANYSSMEGK